VKIAAADQHTLGGRRWRRAAPRFALRAWRFGPLSVLLRDGVRPLLVIADVSACLVGGVVARTSLLAIVLLTGLVLVLHGTGGLYRSRLQLSLLDDVPQLVGRWVVAIAILLLSSGTAGPHSHDFVEQAGSTLIALLAARAGCYAVVRWLRRTGVVSHSTLIVGTGTAARRVAEALRQHPEYGLDLRGFLGNRAAAGLPAPQLGEISELRQVLQRSGTKVVVLAYGQLPDSELVSLVRDCHRSRCELFLIPRLFELHQLGDNMEMIWGMPLVRLRRSAGRSASWRLKRIFDIVFAVVALVVLAPLLAICAAAVRIEGGPGVIFRQQRVGMDGRPFELMKFRSMTPVDDLESQSRWTISHDPRLGRVGRLLRISSLDELPQLINILRGDMSVVGPRPERPQFVEEFATRFPGYLARHRVPSGLTGWAQVHVLRGDTC
jgi:exopolysaccharide biosynthesis polyprenyl glycosylphosphotransferase